MTNKPKRVERLSEDTFIFICLDGNNTEGLRKKHLFGHLRHIEENNDKYRVAGPLKSHEKGGEGSFFMVAGNSESEARAVIDGDPYVSSGLFETITVYPFIPACGEWMGGVTWDQDEVRADIKRYT